MKQDGSAGAVAEGQLSVVQLGRLHERVVCLREHLKAALLHDGPQLEMLVYTALSGLYEGFYHPFLVSRLSRTSVTTTAAPAAVTAEARFVASAYTQDVLAACVYLMDGRSLPDVHLLPPQPPSVAEAHDDDNASTTYVSVAQRQFCFSLFMFLCWADESLPLRDVLHALYPLLDPGSTSSDAARNSPQPSPAENSIAAALFSQARFAGRKRFLGETLTGLVVSRPNGLRALLSVLLLNDRVAAGMTSEAAEVLVRLLTAPAPSLWLRSPCPSSRTGACVAHNMSFSIEDQLVLMAPQLLPLLEEQADEAIAQTEKDAAGKAPRFLARLQAADQRLPAETVEERLHLFLALYVNALVRLPCRRDPAFARCYRQFFYTNKHILAPAFGCLSLRTSGPFTEPEALAAVRRLTTLAKGVGLGAGTGALTHVLPATAVGLLNLCALLRAAEAEETHSRVCTAPARPSTASDGALRAGLQTALRTLLANATLHEIAAHAFVQACSGGDTAHSWRLGNAVEHGFYYAVSAPCTTRELIDGLEWLLMTVASDAAAGFVHACVESIVDVCQLTLYASGVDSLEKRFPTVLPVDSRTDGNGATADDGEVSGPPLLPLLEQLCLSASPDAIFGAPGQLSLNTTLTLLSRVLSLSAVLYRWSLGLLSSLLTESSVRAVLDAEDSAMSSKEDSHVVAALGSRQRSLARLLRTLQSLLSTLTMLHDDAPVHTTHRVAWVQPADPALTAIGAHVRDAVQRCVAFVVERMETDESSGSCRRAPTPLSGSHSTSDVIVGVMTHWQRLQTRLESAMDARNTAEVSITLTMLTRSVDDAVHEMVDPQPLSSLVQSLLLSLLRVLSDCDDVGCAARAVHCVTWLTMYRFDSSDSAFVADTTWAVLGEEQPSRWLADAIHHHKPSRMNTAAAAAQLCRLRVRWLDVLLAWTDYDSDGRTLHNVDDALRRTRHVSLYDVLAHWCHGASDVFVQVATLHFMGSYALAVQPRVPLAALCDLCRDVFRLSPHAMAKAACAAALGKVVAALCDAQAGSPSLLTEVDLNTVQSLASAMASYRGRPANTVAVTGSVFPTSAATAMDAAAAAVEDLHDAVIQQHGRDMLKLLREAAMTLGGSPVPEPTVARQALELPELRRR